MPLEWRERVRLVAKARSTRPSRSQIARLPPDRGRVYGRVGAAHSGPSFITLLTAVLTRYVVICSAG